MSEDLPRPRRLKRVIGLCARKTCGHLLTVVHDIFNLGLVGIVLIQVYVLIRPDIPVPGLIKDRIERELAAAGLEAHFNSAQFDPTGRILIQGLRLEPERFGEPIVEARLVLVELDPLFLAAGKPVLARLEAEDVRLKCPCSISPSGQTETILQIAIIGISQDDGRWEIEHLVAKAGGVHVTARGSIRASAGAGTGAKARPDVDRILQRFAELAPQVVRQVPWLDSVADPRIDLSFEGTIGGALAADLRLSASSWEDPRVGLARGIRLQTHVQIGGTVDVPVVATGRIEELVREDGIRVSQVDVRARWEKMPTPTGYMPDRIDLAVHDAAHPKLPLGAIIATIEPRAYPKIQARAWLHGEGETISLRAQGDVKERSGEAWLSGRFGRTFLARGSTILGRDATYYATIDVPPDGDAHAVIEPGAQDGYVEFRAITGPIIARGVPLDRARVRGVLRRGGVTIDHLEFSLNGDEGGVGSYSDSFTTRDFRFTLPGHVRPRSISKWFGPWWDKFWSDYQLNGPAPAVQIMVDGTWKRAWTNIVTGTARASNVVVRGVPFDEVSGRFFIRSNYFDIYDATLLRPEGRLDGEVQIALQPGQRDPFSETFRFESTADIVDMVRIFGAGGEALFAPYRYDIPPAVKASGVVINDHGTWSTTLDIGIETEKAFRYHDFPLESLSTEVHIAPEGVDLPRIRAGYAGGIATATANTRNGRLTFDAKLDNADYDLAGELFRDYLNRRSPPPPGEEEPAGLAARKTEGRLHMTLAASGPIEQFQRYEGRGTVRVTEAHLGRIQIFGLLGDLFNTVGLKLGVLNFREASSSFEVRRDRLLFPDVRITGPTAALETNGTYFLRDSTVDFRARLFPLRESNGAITQLFGALLDPFSHLFEVRLTGTLRKPKWEFTRDPISLIRSITTPKEPETPETDEAGAAPQADAATPPAATAAPQSAPIETSPTATTSPGG